MRTAVCLISRELALAAGAVVAALYVARALPRLPRAAPDLPPAAAVGMTFPNPARLPPNYARAVLEQRLRDGDAVLFGSSELAFDGEMAPHRFFPAACGKRILTMGRAGYQSLPILLTLAEVEGALSARSDVTLILSPGWFAEFGTPSGAFLRFLKPDALRTLFARDDLPPAVRDAVAREIRIHRDEFSGLYPDWIFPWVPALARLAPAADFEPCAAPAVPQPTAPAFDWDAAELRQKNLAIAAAEGNPLGTGAAYYRKNQGKLPKAVTPLDRWDVERKDLYALSGFLNERGVRARIIVQPVHRRVYRDLRAYDERLNQALARLVADGHRVVDYNREPFDPQLLEDSVHFGGYGWAKMQREMCRR